MAYGIEKLITNYCKSKIGEIQLENGGRLDKFDDFRLKERYNVYNEVIDKVNELTKTE